MRANASGWPGVFGLAAEKAAVVARRHGARVGRCKLNAGDLLVIGGERLQDY